MGEVFAAEDPALGRQVAVKLLAASLVGNAEFRERFRREAVAMARLVHPQVLQIFELGEHQGRPFFAMERVDGGDVAEHVAARGPLPVQTAARWLLDAARGLGAAAELGLVHRDVKPANLMIQAGRVKVSDFGIARVLAPEAALTQVGLVMGTPDYMAPEQALGMPVDARADIYALGLSAFHMLTGRPPFSGGQSQVLQAQLRAPLPDLRAERPGLPPELCALIARMAQKRPDARPQGYPEIAAALAPFTGEDAPAQGGPPSVLRFMGAPYAGKRVALPLGESFVGRQEDCLIVLDSPQVSRRHASLLRGDAGLSVRDLGSRNGVRVNGARVPQAALEVGDTLHIGDAGFRVESAGPLARRVTDPALPVPAAALGLDARLALLRDLARTLATGRVLQASSLEVLCTQALFPLRRFALVRIEGESIHTLAHVARAEADKVAPVQAAMRRCVAAGAVVHIADARRDPELQGSPPAVATVGVAPLCTAQGVAGVLYGDAREAQVLSPDDLAAFEALANLLACLLPRMEG